MSSYKVKINKRVVEGLQPNQTVWDFGEGSIPGFGVRKQRRNAVFFLKGRIGSRQRWVTIGKYGAWTVDQARREARTILGDLARGTEPAELVSPHLSVLAERFLDEEIRPKRAAATTILYSDLWERLAKPRLGALTARDVSFRDIAELHNSLRETPITANRMIAVLSSFFSWCERHGWRDRRSNPAFGLKKFPEVERKRYLSPVELRKLGETLTKAEIDNSESAYVIAAIRLLILTGCRRNEILTLRWESVDLERKCFFLPTSKTGARTIYLSAPAVAIFKGLPRGLDNPYVIVGDRPGQHLVNLRKPWVRLSLTAGIDGVRLHDLRHSFASLGVNDGMSLPVIGKLLGHTKAATTDRYSHLAADPIRQANEQIGSLISAIWKESK